MPRAFEKITNKNNHFSNELSAKKSGQNSLILRQ
jgi:hypothetical protein